MKYAIGILKKEIRYCELELQKLQKEEQSEFAQAVNLDMSAIFNERIKSLVEACKILEGCKNEKS
jgi:predicted type IV restriction endonuclease